MAPKATAGKAIQQAPPISSRPQQTPSPSGHKFFEAPAFSPFSTVLGNQAMLSLLKAGQIQPKLRVSQPGDPDELEADRVAAQVMSKNSVSAPCQRPSLPLFAHASPALHRKCSCSGGTKCAQCEEEEVESAKGIHRKASSGSKDASVAPDSLLRGLGSGRALEPPLRKSMESRFGQDFGGVRIHDDSAAAQSAKAINAHAYTSGSHIYFGSGSYAPQSSDGQRLLAHELVHVVQQRGGNTPKLSSTVPSSDSKAIGSAASSPSISPQPAAVQRLTLSGEAGTLYECAKASKRSIINLAKFDVHSIADLLGIPKPERGDPSVLDQVLMVLKHPCLQLVPGYGMLATKIAQIEKARNFLKAAWKIIQNPNIVLDPMREAIGKLIAKIPGAVKGFIDKYTAKANATVKKLVNGIWRHLELKLEYIAQNWWTVIKETASDLIWPWPSVGKQINEVGVHVSACAENLWNLELNKSLDEFLEAWGGINSIGGLLSGWFTLASVLIGAIIGAFFGGAGAIPGAAAGFEFAASVGEVILASTITREEVVILKALVELLGFKQTEAQEEANYEKVAGSGLTLGITLAMMLLGAMVARLTKGIFNKVAGMFKKPPAVEPPKIQVPKVEPPKVETPRVQAPKAEAPKLEAPKSQSPKTEAPKVETPKTETPKAEPPKTETAKPEAPKTEPPKAETPKAEPPKAEAPKAEPPKTETAKPEAPKTEPSSTETPKAEPPKAETPKAEPPKTESPSKEAPKAEAPKGEAPKSETPEQSKEPGKSPEESEPKEGEEPKGRKKGGKEDPQAGVKKRLEGLKKNAVELQETLDTISEEISKAKKNIEALKQKTSASSGEARVKASEELQTARKDLADLNREYKDLTDVKVKNLEDQGKLVEALKQGTYDRPSFQKGIRDSVWDSAKGPDGVVRDPLTGKEIKPGDPWEMGHKPGYEFWKQQQSAAERGISREQFIKECNDPKIYRPETPETNASHKLEAPDHVYLGK
jgi:hypothetical protein